MVERRPFRNRGALVDTNGGEIYTWAFRPSESQAFPGEAIDYRTRIAYRSGATSITITFVSEQEIADLGLELIDPPDADQ